MDGAVLAIRRHGIAGVSARTVAACAGVNQALVFYHFGTLDDLLAAACHAATARRVAAYHTRFAAVGSLRELLDLGRELHERERAEGNLGVLAQLLAGAQSDDRLAPATAAALRLWVDEIEQVLRRLLAGSPLAELADPVGLARTVAAGFIGLELYDGVDPSGAQDALAALDQLAVLVDVVDDLGPIARRALRSRLGQRRRTAPIGLDLPRSAPDP
ncbi:TetR/AcrR family transcriptional regulator [Solwaraspora sp. WMMD406]|uniref:TetR/AcrR family transcriptional regulator n=1 Tax=Solwaraspora sp. WMMD406 TaxID=3016095 RepID=UPI00241721BA|nr:TetR/AcrR family transcriptional regulator [Solwaraspora sp. WMMD406]MDG4767945.1 TetR/AcrR family transcriptional regulator [Solwaraspora sp. WMMD406]